MTTVPPSSTPVKVDMAPAPPKQRRKKPLAVGAAALVLGALALYGAHWWSEGRFLEETDDAYVGGDITVVSAKVPGYIVKTAVTDNQAVHAGDLLVKLDD